MEKLEVFWKTLKEMETGLENRIRMRVQKASLFEAPDEDDSDSFQTQPVVPSTPQIPTDIVAEIGGIGSTPGDRSLLTEGTVAKYATKSRNRITCNTDIGNNGNTDIGNNDVVNNNNNDVVNDNKNNDNNDNDNQNNEDKDNDNGSGDGNNTNTNTNTNNHTDNDNENDNPNENDTNTNNDNDNDNDNQNNDNDNDNQNNDDHTDNVSGDNDNDNRNNDDKDNDNGSCDDTKNPNNTEIVKPTDMESALALGPQGFLETYKRSRFTSNPADNEYIFICRCHKCMKDGPQNAYMTTFLKGAFVVGKESGGALNETEQMETLFLDENGFVSYWHPFPTTHMLRGKTYRLRKHIRLWVDEDSPDYPPWAKRNLKKNTLSKEANTQPVKLEETIPSNPAQSEASNPAQSGNFTERLATAMNNLNQLQALIATAEDSVMKASLEAVLAKQLAEIAQFGE